MISAARNTAHLLGCPHQDCQREVLCDDRCAERGVNIEPPPISGTHVPSPTDPREVWIICPYCSAGPGVDHKKGCPRGHWKFSPERSIGLSEEQVAAAKEKSK